MAKKKYLFSLLAVIVAFFSMLVLNTSRVSADIEEVSYSKYDPNLNKILGVEVDQNDGNNGSIKVKLQYQYGFNNLTVTVCDPTSSGNLSRVTRSECLASSRYGRYVKSRFSYGQSNIVYMATDVSPGVVNTMTIKFTSPQSGTTPISDYPLSDEIVYSVELTANFCRIPSSNGTGCVDWDKTYSKSTTSAPNLGMTFTIDSVLTDDPSLNKEINQVLKVISNFVIPILWMLLGAIFIVRAIVLAIGVMKTADEPEARRQKLAGFMWMTIGIGLGYIVTVVGKIVLSQFGYGGFF